MLFVNVRAHKDEDFIDLQLGEMVERHYELSRAYRLDRVGRYTVQAIYENQIELILDSVWKSRLESNVVSFTISYK
mgnify:CR=1 FL=1